MPSAKPAAYAGQPSNSNSEAAKPDSPDPPLFVAPAKSGGSGLFDALLMAAATGIAWTGMCWQACKHGLRLLQIQVSSYWTSILTETCL